VSYSMRRGLRGVPDADAYPIGTFMAGGFQVIGLPSSAAAGAVQKLTDAFAASFPVGTIAPPATSGADTGRPTVGWGPAYGVDTGRLYAVISTNRDGITGAQANDAFGAVARDLSNRLGLVVNLTNAHTLGNATPLPALTPQPGVTPDSSVSPMLIGGVVASGVALLLLTVALVRRRPVARNRGRRRRR